MASDKYDIVTVGGGLGGAALTKTMTEQGARVLVLERERQFKDRVRGDYACLGRAGSTSVGNLRLASRHVRF
jgi:choline dehydrogenase-like flavoprotein